MNKEIRSMELKRTIDNARNKYKIGGLQVDKEARLMELKRTLDNARNKYYDEDTSVISDKEYDELEAEYEELAREAYSGGIGYEVVSKLKKVKHMTPMLSLDKTKDIDKIKEFVDIHKVDVSYKLDGITLVLSYKDGKLRSAVTRGNGEIGEDVTHNARVFSNIPLEIPYKKDLTIRGEALLSYKDFDAIVATAEGADYKNARNLASGTTRQLDSSVTAKRNMKFICFRSETDIGCDSKFEELEQLKNWGFAVVKTKQANIFNIGEVIEEMSDLTNIEFPVDGLVITYDSRAYSESLGSTSKSPKHSIAFKWTDDIATTKLRYVEWSVSRTGLINPIAVFEPVELEGTTVSRASLHNIDILRGLELGIGDEIRVYKANKIIPQVYDNLTKSDTVEIPEECPVCRAKTEFRHGRDATVLCCTNEDCSARILRKLMHFVSRDGMNIEGLADGMLEKLLDNGLITNRADIYKLHEYRFEFMDLYRDGEVIVDKLLESIEISRDVAIENFIYALGIQNVGLTVAKALAKRFKGDIRAIINANMTDIIDIDGIGGKIAQNIYDYFTRNEDDEEFNELLNEVRFIEPEAEEELEQTCAGVTFVVTGDLSRYENRDELKKRIELRGGKMVGSVSKKTSYLITNDKNSGTGKNKKAQELGIPILNELEYIELFGW